MTIPKMLKAHKSVDKLKLIKEEEEAIPELPDTRCEIETSNCETRCRRIICYAVLSGMLLLAYFCILLGWQSYMKQLQNNETEPIFYIYGIPMLQMKDLTEDINTNTLGTTGNDPKNFYRRKRSTQTVIGLQSQDHDDYNKKDEFHLRGDENSPNVENSFSPKNHLLNKNSDALGNLLDKIIETEQLESKAKNSFKNRNVDEQEILDMKMNVASHLITEEEEKIHFINTNIHSQNKDIGSNKAEIEISQIYNLDRDQHYKSTIIKNISTDDSLSLRDEIYWGILLACGILLIILFGLWCIFVFKRNSKKLIKHYKLEEDNEIYTRRNPLNLPATPIEKDLRFKENIEKFDLFCNIYE